MFVGCTMGYFPLESAKCLSQRSPPDLSGQITSSLHPWGLKPLSTLWSVPVLSWPLYLSTSSPDSKLLRRQRWCLPIPMLLAPTHCLAPGRCCRKPMLRASPWEGAWEWQAALRWGRGTPWLFQCSWMVFEKDQLSASNNSYLLFAHGSTIEVWGRQRKGAMENGEERWKHREG